MPEYLEPPKHPLSPAAAAQADRKGPLKRCGHAPDYRCACAAHEDPEQHPDLVDELTIVWSCVRRLRQDRISTGQLSLFASQT